jgi:transketolase
MGAQRQADWQRRFADYAQTYPQLAREFERRVIKRQLPANWAAATAQFMAKLVAGGSNIATRKASQNAIETLHGLLPELLGGSADLTGSNLTAAKASTAVRGDRWGDYINYGVREFGMSAAMNGIALHGGYIPFGGTFLTFSDYSRNAIRMSALMQQCVIYVFSHDSIGLGEDGPTHQPIEHVSCLRLIPNNDVWRPCDDVETLAAWLSAAERSDGPTCLILSRQNLPHCERTPRQVEDIRKGGYVLAESDGAVVTLLATGSEVSLAMQARAALADLGLFVRVVSMPSCREFDRQSLAYRSAVLPRDIPVLAIEAGVTNFWRAYVGLDGDVVGIDRFGESAPALLVAQELGLTVNAVVDRAQILALRGASC